MKIIDINGEERDCVKVYPDPKFAGYMKVEFASKTALDILTPNGIRFPIL